MKGNCVKVVSVTIVISMLLTLFSGLTFTTYAYSAGDSFTIYSYPQNSNNTAGRSYIWAFAPDARVDRNGDNGARAQFFRAGDGIVHKPNEGSLDGLNTTVIVTHRACATGYSGNIKVSGNSDLAAVVTYKENGVIKKSPAFRFTGFHYNNKQWKDCGEENTISTFNIGTYPNVVSVNVYHLLSSPQDGSTLIMGTFSAPYHENVRFRVEGAAGEPVIPVNDYYIETEVLPNEDSGLPMATPAPTAVTPASAGETPVPYPNIVSIQNGPVVAFGLGTAFSLFPGDMDASSVNATNSIIENAAPNLNADNGVTRYELADGASVSHSIPWGINNTTFKGSNASKVIFRPTAGRLQGVVTKIKAYSLPNGGNGLDAIITYDGGKTATVNFLPDNYQSSERTTMFDLGNYPNVEYVTVVKRGNNDQRIPSIIFKVVNENVNSTESLISEKVYERPFIDTVAPKISSMLPVPNVQSPISINEAIADNTLGFVDKYGKKSDWIEIYNSSDSDVDISGYGLTDSVKKPFKWVVPNGTVVPHKGYLVIVASGNNTINNGEIHTNFSISKDGETLMLSNPDGGIVSVLDIPSIAKNTSISRVSDGTDNLRVTVPTIGQSNNTAEVLSVVVPKPEFSENSGFYDDPFDLSITSQGGTVHYTTNGSEPDENSPVFGNTLSVFNRTSEPNYFSAITYNTSSYVPSVNVDKCTVIRAVNIDGEGNKSEVVTKTYFVGLDIKNDYNNTMIV